ncbi:MAG TPA: trigger factor [Ktedonobacteraceae bacterium]|nr:trigger factor [Ktedonobacteraceae bacterium]
MAFLFNNICVGGKVKVSVEKLPGSEARVEVDFSWEELEKASDKAFRKLVQKIDIRGFRRGKAPRSLVERQLGKDYIYQEGLDELMNETYRSAIKENDITPLAQPEIDAPVLEIGQPYHFSLTVPVLTPVELGDYRSLHFEREEATITSEEVEQQIELIRDRKAHWDEIERAVEMADRVTVDLKLTSEDQTISDLKDNPFELTNERVGLFSGMDEHLLGMKAGESKSFTTTIPADYANEKLAGKEAHYDIMLHKVEAKHVPEVDDALAMEVSEGDITSVEDLRKAISDELLANKKRRNAEALRDKVVDAVIEQSTFAVHPVLIKDEAEEMMHQLSHVLEDQRMSMDQYLMIMRKSRDEYLKEIEPEAEKRVKRQLVLDAIAKQDEVEVSPEDLEKLARAYAQAGQPIPRSQEQLRALATSLLREKTITHLVDLTAGPDPDEENEEEEVAEANAEAAALAGEEDATEIASKEAEEPIAAPDVDSSTVDSDVEAQAAQEAH